jgi:hypothetical protein
LSSFIAGPTLSREKDQCPVISRQACRLQKRKGLIETRPAPATTAALPGLVVNQRTAVLTNLLLMTILAQAFFAFVRGHFVSLALLSTGQKANSFRPSTVGKRRGSVKV